MFQPAQVLAISFAAAIVIGTILLLLPFSTKSGQISLMDALFTATSAVCVTGLIVQDTPAYFSPFGQTVILILIQLGGLGIMTFSTLVLLVSRRKISIKDRIMVQEGFHPGAPRDFMTLIKNIFRTALLIELVGCFFFFFRLRRDFSWEKALFSSVFHSISAFCNAGFSLFSDSFALYRKDIWLNLTLISLIILGGMGFLVLHEGAHILTSFFRRKKRQVSLHTKLVLTVTGILILISFGIFLLSEWNGALKTFSLQEKILGSLFQVVTPRTAGFNTMRLTTLGTSSVLLVILLMFIGASPGSTGGGVKTSTLGVIFVFLKSKIIARETANLYYRTLPSTNIIKAFTLISLALCLIFFSSFVLFLCHPDWGMKEVIFEVFSAFGTVGLSLGVTPKLSDVGKFVIVLTMYAGRIGPLTLLYAFSRQKALGRFEYVEEAVMIG